MNWEQKKHCEQYLLYPQNLSSDLSIDEVSLSKGELYTFITNKSNNGRKGSLVACVQGTKSEDIQAVLEKLPLKERLKPVEITLDMAPNMALAIKNSFPNATLTTDRFHVVKLVNEALQHLRIKYRWKAIEDENKAIAKGKKKNKKIKIQEYENGDTAKQLLARSRYIIAKKPNDWTKNQKQRADILFKVYPLLEKAYHLVLEFRNIYEELIKMNAEEKLKQWLKKANRFEENIFKTAIKSIENHFTSIINFFKNRKTNANAESFNARLKLFRANQRGVANTSFFLFRVEKLFA